LSVKAESAADDRDSHEGVTSIAQGGRMKAGILSTTALAVSVLFGGAAGARQLDTFAGPIDLPFDFHLVDRIDESGNSVLEFSATQRLRVAIESGPLQGREATVTVGYALPVKGDSEGRVRDSLRQPGARSSRPAQLGRFPFSVYDRDWTGLQGAALTSSTMIGSINNAMLTVSLERPAGRELDASTEQAVTGFALDFAAVLRARARFDEAARGASAGWKMLTPAGDYFVEGLTPQLYSTWTETGGDGRAIASRNAYAFVRAGFWGRELMSFASACGVEGGQAALARESRIEPDSAYSRIVSQSAPMRGRIGKLEATHFDTKFASTRSGFAAKSSGSRWIAVDGDSWYAFDFLSNRDSAFEQDLRDEINHRPLACAPRVLLTLGNAAPAGVR